MSVAIPQRLTNGDNMKNRLTNKEKSFFVINSRCFEDGELLPEIMYDRLMTYRVINEDNYLEEILGYLEWKENTMNENTNHKYEIILFDIFQNV